MKLLTNLLTLAEGKKDDLSKLPNDLMKDVQKNVRKGAEDLQQKWANALELVHKAYEVAAVQRPSPDMKDAWEQYEENIAYAVKQLGDSRGMDDDWRMSSAMFHEAFAGKHQKYRVKFGENTYIVEMANINDVVDDVLKKVEDDPDFDHLDAEVEKTQNGVQIRFSSWGIKKNDRVVIERVLSQPQNNLSWLNRDMY